MRVAALALVVLVGAACRRGSLQVDAGGAGPIGLDGGGGALEGDGGPGGSGGDRAGIDGAPGGSDAALPGPDANCGVVTSVSRIINPQILLLIDQSITDRTRWNLMLMAVGGMIVGHGPRIDWGLYTFPKRGPACGAETVSDVIDLPVTSENYEAGTAAVGSVWLGGSGRPTAAAIRVAADYLRTLSPDQPRFLMLVTDGAPTCAGSIGALSADATQAQTDAIAAISAAFADGLPTMVVAPEMLAGSEREAVNALAVAGGYANPGPGIRYITEAGLSPLLGPPHSTCTFALPDPPPVPDRVAVTINGAPVPRDPAHIDGWDYTDASHRAFTFNGSWCELVSASRQLEVTFYYGCP